MAIIKITLNCGIDPFNTNLIKHASCDQRARKMNWNNNQGTVVVKVIFKSIYQGCKTMNAIKRAKTTRPHPNRFLTLKAPIAPPYLPSWWKAAAIGLFVSSLSFHWATDAHSPTDELNLNKDLAGQSLHKKNPKKKQKPCALQRLARHLNLALPHGYHRQMLYSHAPPPQPSVGVLVRFHHIGRTNNPFVAGQGST